MNKRTLFTILLSLATMTGLPQEIKMNETTINDYIPMLFQLGEYYSLCMGSEAQANLLGE